MSLREPDTEEMRENELLAALPAEDFERLLPGLEHVILPPFELLPKSQCGDLHPLQNRRTSEC